MGVSGQQHAPATLYPWERPGTNFTGGWVGPRAGLDLIRSIHSFIHGGTIIYCAYVHVSSVACVKETVLIIIKNSQTLSTIKSGIQSGGGSPHMQGTPTNFEVVPTHSKMDMKCTDSGHLNCKLTKQPE